ncbi:MAG: HD domain-containing protein, partial [Gammaproteobacteria bacterium]|nr:HD domain-containing protein [Gammaproteobacteria bacterium]
AKTIGLLHDVARFEQYMRYRTFNDRLSFDHGAFGVDLLKCMEWFMNLEPPTQEIIERAIFNHNKAKISQRLEGNQLLQTRLIRDADKLDILHMTCKRLKSRPLFSSNAVPNSCLDVLSTPYFSDSE